MVQPELSIVLPCYNESRNLPVIVERLSKFWPATNFELILVNNGSTDNTSEILNKFNQIDIVSYPKNKGKGYALRQGFKFAWSKAYEYAITIDSDGQHFATDLPNFVEAIEKNPNAIIIGNRNMEQEGIPGKSSFGNRFSNFWFKFETGIKMPDTQSGYRLYLDTAQLMRLKNLRLLPRVPHRCYFPSCKFRSSKLRR